MGYNRPRHKARILKPLVLSSSSQAKISDSHTLNRSFHHFVRNRVDNRSFSLEESMQRSCRSLSRFLASNRGFCTTSKGSGNDKIVASVLFERLPVVIPKIDPSSTVFKNSHENSVIITHVDIVMKSCSFRWRQQFRRAYPEEFLKKSDAR
ncbi:hypothetical protein LXL04_027838 [Taraxacum kok-saghyz]